MRKAFSVVLAICMIIAIAPLGVVEVKAVSGTIESCTWTLEGTKLTISGNGSIGFGNPMPWGDDITELIIEDGITEIGANAFSGYPMLNSISLPSTLKVIDAAAFSYCTALTSVVLPDGVVKMEGGAFYGCTDLIDFHIPKTLVSIGMEFLSDCGDLVVISVDDQNPSYKSVDGILFNKSETKLIKYPAGKVDSSYRVPSTVTEIGYKAFIEAWYLDNVYLHDGITKIGINAFFQTKMYSRADKGVNGGFYIGEFFICAMDKKSTDFPIKEGTKVIADGAFSGCSSLKTITVPDGVVTIGENAFAWCSKLDSISIPDSVNYIGESAFVSCTSLDNIYYRGGLEDRQKMFIGGDNKDLNIAEWFYNACTSSEHHAWGDWTDEATTSESDVPMQKHTCVLCGAFEVREKVTEEQTQALEADHNADPSGSQEQPQDLSVFTVIAAVLLTVLAFAGGAGLVSAMNKKSKYKK